MAKQKHYFIADDAPLNIHKFNDFVAGSAYEFLSADGVFSKDKIDFGSKTLIEYLLDSENLKGEMLDIGCGIGALTLVLAQNFSELKGKLFDVNQNAVELAKQNISDKGLDDRFQAFCFDVNNYKNINIKASYDIAVCNPPIRAGKSTVFNCYNYAEKALKAGGKLYVVIQKKQGAASSKKQLETIFSAVNVVQKNAGYHIIEAIK